VRARPTNRSLSAGGKTVGRFNIDLRNGKTPKKKKDEIYIHGKQAKRESSRGGGKRSRAGDVCDQDEPPEVGGSLIKGGRASEDRVRGGLRALLREKRLQHNGLEPSEVL